MNSFSVIHKLADQIEVDSTFNETNYEIEIDGTSKEAVAIISLPVEGKEKRFKVIVRELGFVEAV